MKKHRCLTCAAAAGALVLAVQCSQTPAQEPLGFTDTPMLPGQPWRVHDIRRPHPRQVTPGAQAGQPPSDAVVLFDGRDLSQWHQRSGAPRWKLGNGYVEVAGGTGDLISNPKFGDCQIHLEWSAPTTVTSNSQGRGNSGVLIMGRYEIQVLDDWDNPTYADGTAGAIYGQFPPLVLPARRPGEWQTYDIAFEAPRFEGGKLAKPAFVTVFFNGVLVENHQQIMGAVVYRKVARYTPHASEEPLVLQDHGNPVRYRNIWVRRVAKPA
jgi:hypothetical protein